MPGTSSSPSKITTRFWARYAATRQSAHLVLHAVRIYCSSGSVHSSSSSSLWVGVALFGVGRGSTSLKSSFKRTTSWSDTRRGTHLVLPRRLSARIACRHNHVLPVPALANTITKDVPVVSSANMWHRSRISRVCVCVRSSLSSWVGVALFNVGALEDCSPAREHSAGKAFFSSASWAPGNMGLNPIVTGWSSSLTQTPVIPSTALAYSSLQCWRYAGTMSLVFSCSR